MYLQRGQVDRTECSLRRNERLLSPIDYLDTKYPVGVDSLRVRQGRPGLRITPAEYRRPPGLDYEGNRGENYKANGSAD